MNTKQLQEFKTLLSKFNKGVRSVEFQYGIVTVWVTGKTRESIKRNAQGVIHDMRLTKAFQTITCTSNARDGGLLIHCAI